MCVIFVAKDVRPTEEMISQGYTANPSGAGIAWREEGKVVWKKGLDLDEIQELVAKVPLPFVSHFRIPTVGGHSAQLTHPFPIDWDSSNKLEGSTDDTTTSHKALAGAVLFHNGHWNMWESKMLEWAARGGWGIPEGKYSDSRAMAVCAAHLGPGFLELTSEMVCAFGPKRIAVFGPRWSQVNGVWVSNRAWEGRTVTTWKSDKKEVHSHDVLPDESEEDTRGNRTDGGRGSPYTTPPASLLPSGQKQLTAGRDKTDELIDQLLKGRNASNTSGAGDPESDPFEEAEARLARATEAYSRKQLSKRALRRARKKHDEEISRLTRLYGQTKPSTQTASA